MFIAFLMGIALLPEQLRGSESCFTLCQNDVNFLSNHSRECFELISPSITDRQNSPTLEYMHEQGWC